MWTTLFVIVAIAVFAAILFLFTRRPAPPADGGGLRDAEQSADSVGANVAEALEGATPYVPEAMRDRPVKAGGLRAASEDPARQGPDTDYPAPDPGQAR